MKKEEIVAGVIVAIVVIVILSAAYFVGKWQIDTQNKYEKDLSDAKYQVFIESKNFTTTEEKLKSIYNNCDAYVNYDKIKCIRTLRNDFFADR